MCISPSHFWLLRGPKWEQIPKGCGDCWRCKANRVNDFVGRGLCEAQTADWTLFLTLTYRDRDDLAEKIVHPPHFQNFIRSLRDRHHKIRYLASGEYGELKGRAHFHCVLFGTGPRLDWPHEERFWHDAWPHGHMWPEWTRDERAMRYVAKYLLKDSAEQTWFQPSKRPPLGSSWFQAKALDHVACGVMPRAFEYMPPGGTGSRRYLLTGATRDQFIDTVLDGYKALGREVPLERCSEFVRKTVEARRRLAHVRWANSATLEEQEERLREDLERRRPDQRQVNKALMDDLTGGYDGWEHKMFDNFT